MAVLVLALWLLGSAAFLLGLVRAVSSEIPKLDPARQSLGDVDGKIYASNGRSVLAVLKGSESRRIVPGSAISPIMKQAIVAIEDQRYYEHNGVDVRGVMRALWADVRTGSVVQGGSTITQQFVKNAYAGNQNTLARKVREAALAWQLEQKWSKDRILTAYLNTIYFGNGAYGVQRAAQTYFGVGARRLTLPQAALLAGMPRDPSRYDPISSPRAARARRLDVLQRLFEQGRITAADLRSADRAPVPTADDVRPPGGQGPAPYFTNFVKDQLVAQYGANRVFGGGLEVTTTIDLKLQTLATRAIQQILPDQSGPAAALVAIDPRNGAVRALVGGTNYRRSQFNLATQAERQPGSAFKPIVLATAFRQGISPGTTLDSKPVTIDAGDRSWQVRNYESSYLGRANLRTGMIKSDNAVYAQLTQLVTPRAIVAMAHDLGVRTDLSPYFSLGLGAEAVNPLDMARAYATIANDGNRVEGSVFHDRARVITEVDDTRNRRVYRNDVRERPVLSSERARMLTDVLRGVVTEGTGKRAAIPGLEIAGKTGTTDNYGDAWFVGYTPELVVAVWVGYPDELRPMLTEFHGESVAGGTYPALIWRKLVAAARRQKLIGATGFARPGYVGQSDRRVVRRGGWRLDNGYCTGTRVISYFAGAEPQDVAACRPNEVSVPNVEGGSADYARAVLAPHALRAQVIYVPARVGEQPGLVVNQEPAGGGYLGSGDSVRIYVTKARHGLVPNLVGSTLAAARNRARGAAVRLRVTYVDGPRGIVARQRPEAGVASGPGLVIKLAIGRGTTGSATASREDQSATALRSHD